MHCHGEEPEGEEEACRPSLKATQLRVTRHDAERFARRTRRGLTVFLTVPPLAFILLVEVPDPHPAFFLASILYVAHLVALLRPVWTGESYPVSRAALLGPAFVWPTSLWLLPYAGACSPAESVPLAGLAVVPAAVAVAVLPLRVQLAVGAMCLAITVGVSPYAPSASFMAAGSVLMVIIVAVRSAMRPVSVISRLDSAADVAALLAVAEERLRMSRDLHDTLGRHLAVIAVKTELIAHTGRTEEMEEVQMLARASQRELRAVVNAVRTASLDDELNGARSLLQASGVRCDLSREDSGLDLPAEVREVLGWAVREAATNVIRHAIDATDCAITLSLVGVGDARECVLRVVNNGVRSMHASGLGPGAGLDGLRQRVAPLGGRLEHGPRPGGRYSFLIGLPLRERSKV
ncbi:histidine kinase [Streptomyces albidoflavus]